MKSAAHLSRMAYDPVHLLGELLRREADGSYAVACDGRVWNAQRAASCLLEPQPGDEVLISGPDPARVYLIAVTVQADPARATLQTEGELTLRSRTGDVLLQSAGAVRVRAAEYAVEAEDERHTCGRMRMVAKQLHATVGEFRLVGKSYEAVLDRMTLMARLSLRSVSEMDQVRAGAIDFQAEQSARLHAAYTVVTGGDLVKVDAKQIHMG
ncbi:hypothetical protein LMG26858_00560 [Achromobacter anxifer]|uniref:DUF3540 domain-containing protein n=1 Tax=Achromobacter anxifer TaxID=1287737 RepID=A0A6S7C1B0_9BURK|nr:DUF3540 domain-containing protein [Achromobacter anxifer]CAB3828291.1 hypothetical protein LMG26858_00560 [Achromobacter anxifer]